MIEISNKQEENKLEVRDMNSEFRKMLMQVVVSAQSVRDKIEREKKQNLNLFIKTAEGHQK